MYIKKYVYTYNLIYFMDLYREAYGIFTFYSAPGNINDVMMPREKWRVGVSSLDDDTVNSSFKTGEPYLAQLVSW